MQRNEADEIVNGLPIENMIAAPIIAAAKAQREISGMLADYLDKVALDFKGTAGMQAPYVPLKEFPGLSIEAVQGKVSDFLSYSPEKKEQ